MGHIGVHLDLSGVWLAMFASVQSDGLRLLGGLSLSRVLGVPEGKGVFQVLDFLAEFLGLANADSER